MNFGCLKEWIASVRGGNVISYIPHDVTQPIKVNERNGEDIGIIKEGDYINACYRVTKLQMTVNTEQ